MPNRPILNLQGDKIYLFLRLYSTEASKAGRSEIVAARGIRAPPSLDMHTELPSAPSRKELTLLHRLASPLKWTASSSETIHY